MHKTKKNLPCVVLFILSLSCGFGDVHAKKNDNSLFVADYIKITNDTEIDGEKLNCNSITFDPDSYYEVQANKTLTIKNIAIYGLANNNLRCDEISSKIIFENVSLHLCKDFYFKEGSFTIKKDCFVYGPGKKFIYKSSVPSLIDHQSKLTFFTNTTLVLDPKTGNQPILFQAKNSQLILDGATLKITKACNICKGSFVAKNICRFYGLNDSKLSFGDGIHVNQNAERIIASNAIFSIYEGDNEFKNVTSDQDNSVLNIVVIIARNK